MGSEYVGVTLYDKENGSEETKGDLSDLDLNGTALILPVETSVNDEYLKNLWIAQLSRPINCIYGDAKDDKDLLVPGFCYNQTQFSQDTFFLVARNYLNPETKTHPDSKQIVFPRLLYFES